MSANLEYNAFRLFSSAETRFYNMFTIFFEKMAEITPAHRKTNAYAFNVFTDFSKNGRGSPPPIR